jgi:putative redox protein
MKSSITTKWKGNLTFSSDIAGHEVITDAAESDGGNNSAPSPKPLMMVALAGCTGIDVTTILKKMRVGVEDINIEVESEQTDEIPSTYTSMHVIYTFTGNDLDLKKLTRAVELSQDKYCGVASMYKKIMDISWEIRIK